jgi:hypothetical protein
MGNFFLSIFVVGLVFLGAMAIIKMTHMGYQLLRNIAGQFIKDGNRPMAINSVIGAMQFGLISFDEYILLRQEFNLDDPA